MINRKNILVKFLFVFALGALIACETTKIESPRQLLEKENELLIEYLEYIEEGDHNPDLLNNKDYLASIAVDTIDQIGETGFLYYEMETGKGDPIVQGKEVGYRFVEYRILPDTAEIPRVYVASSNWRNANPYTFVMGDDQNTLRRQGIYTGIVSAISHMKLYGKSKVIVPSTIGAGDYVTRMYDLEITYVSP